MTPAAILSVLVKADGIATAQKNLRDFDKTVEKTGKKGSSSLVGLGKTAKWLAGPAAFGAAVLGVKAVSDQFYESNKIAKQTDQVLKSTGKAAGVTAKQVGDLATAISKKTGIDDEAIQSGENLLLTFTKIRNEAGKGNDIFNQSTKVITDMSVALGQDMKSSAIQVGKALNDPVKGVTALQRVGVSFTASQKEQIKGLVEHGKALDAQKLILRELNKEFGGSAAAQATNMDRLKVTFGNLQESIGSVFVPLMEKATGALNTFVDGMMSGTGAGGRLVQILKSLGAWLSTGFTTAIAAASGWLHKHRDDLDAVAHAARNVGTAIRFAWVEVALPIIQRVLPAIKQIVDGTFKAIGGAVDVLTGLLTLDFKRAWQGVKAIFEGGAKAALGVIRAMTAPIREVIAKVADAATGAFGDMWGSIKKVFTSGVNAVIDFLNVLIGAINKIPGVNVGKIGKIGGGGGDRPKQDNLGKTGHLARGGAYARTGGLVNQPITLMGEEAPRYPEFVIPTNPAYRGRARGLLAQAAGAVGMASGGVFSQGDIMNLWTGQHGDPARKLIASAIAMAESGGRAGVTSPNPAGGSNLGLWQIWSGNPGATLDPAGNARAAINLSHNGANWGLWETFVNGAYKQFLGKGRAAGMQGGLPTVGDIVGSFPKVGTLPGLFQGLGKYVIGKATGYVKKQVAGLFQGQGNLGNKGVDSGLSIGVRKAIDLATGLGWAYPSPGQLTSGGHTQGSLHYQGRAVDFGTAGHSGAQAMGLWQALVSKFGLGINELFYDPAGRYIDAHKWHSGAIGGHGDHIHVGFRKGGEWLGSFKNGGITGAEGLAHLHKNEMIVPLKKGGSIPTGPKIKAPQKGSYSKIKVPIGGGRFVTIEEYARLIAAGFNPSDTSRNFGPAFTQVPPPADTASDETVSENTDAIDEQNRLLAQQNDLIAQQNANQLKILALTNQGPQILAAVVAAVNGGIGGNVGLGFQTPSSSGQMARYR